METLTITTTSPDGSVEVETWQEVTSLAVEATEYSKSLLAARIGGAGSDRWEEWPAWSGRPDLSDLGEVIRAESHDRDHHDRLGAWGIFWAWRTFAFFAGLDISDYLEA
jgi:hypothetical protein